MARPPRLILLCVLLLAGCGSDDKDNPSAASESPDCAEECRSSTGGPPVNDCLAVDGDEQCVYTCTDDADCEEPFYSACTATADDGTQICE